MPSGGLTVPGLADHDWKHVAVRHEDGVTELRLHSGDGPLQWNATIHRELVEAFTAVGLDTTTRTVILTGTGDRFCTSIDAESFRGSEHGWDVTWWEGRRMLTALVDIDVPVITAVNGPATIHSELAVMADVVLACPEAGFADHAHFTRGVVPGDGVHFVWTELLGPTKGRWFLLTGATIDAHEALRAGVVHELHPGADLLDRAWSLAREFANQPLPVLRYTRTVLGMDWRKRLGDAVSHGLAVEGLAQYALGRVPLPDPTGD
jgi:enoyl-CoA hydratase/carnithine racemase